jgi:SRSO17 transposase
MDDFVANLRDLCMEFSPMFLCTTKDNTETAYCYLRGLFQGERRNMERMEEAVPEVDYQALQQFITDSPWDSAAVMRGVAAGANALLGGMEETQLLIDESSFVKKGTKSVGVGRQWCGRLGKKENCQVAVFAALCVGVHATLVDTRLFLPESWSANADRCRAAGVPEAAIGGHRNKCQLALEMVRELRAIGILFAWVRADSLYGDSWEFCRGLHEDGERLLVDVGADRLIYLDDPCPRLSPAGTPGRAGRPSAVAHYHAQTAPVNLKSYLATLGGDDWTCADLRPGAKGNIRAAFHHRLVWVWEKDTEQAYRWHLLIRRDLADGRLTYMLSNASPDTAWTELARAGAQRHWIERSFEDAKSQVGLAQYQVRGWRAWHHHMAMCMLAMYFVLRQKLIYHGPFLPLTAGEIRFLLAAFITHAEARHPDFWRQFTGRQHKRKVDIESRARRQKLETERSGIHVIDLTK